MNNYLEGLDRSKFSPMIRQYLEFKDKYPDTILFYRVGDFYELFFNDALIGSKELEIVLTGKDAGVDERVPMCGVPFHAVDAYLDTLVEKGYKVAIVEQIEDPKNAKGIVKRGVTKIVTPGTNMGLDGESIKQNNFLVSVSLVKDAYASDKNHFIFSYIDITTGEGALTNIPYDESLLYAEIIKLNAKEVVIGSEFNVHYFDDLKKVYNILISTEDNKNVPMYFDGLLKDLDKDEKETYARLLNYISKTQMRTLVHLQKVNKYDINSYMKIDYASRRNLELSESIRSQNKKMSLLGILDDTVTAMGSRFLKKSIIFPLINKDEIIKRYDCIDLMKKHFIETKDLRKELLNFYDLERIVGKISYESANPHDLLQLRRSLQNIDLVKKCIDKIGIDYLFDLKTDLDKYHYVFKLIDDSIDKNAKMILRDGHIIKDGYSKELDEVRNINTNGKEYILSIEAKEKERTGIKTLRLGFNKVFGYYIEVSKLQSVNIKDEYGYIRKQTTANSERYITQELKEKEALILRAEEKMIELEIELFTKVRNELKEYSYVLQKLAKNIACLDMMLSFTKISNERNYVRPIINDEHILEIEDGRHPVIENTLKDKFIPNDIYLDDDKFELLITGPNMSGKSTYMRQVALISIMAQIGCFVPAKKANLMIFDSVFTRIGASDDIVSGDSTFMVEMMEVNKALRGASSNSLILMDEIGRGTATFDGMALAQAIIEYIHEHIKCKTLFSTHYHELTCLDEELKHLLNVYVSAEEKNGEIIFLHKVKKGSVDRSYGVNVAKLANLPIDLIIRANDILGKLESNEKLDVKKLSLNNYVAPLVYDSKSELETYVLNEIKNADIYSMSPLDAMNKLNELQNKLKK